MNRRHFLGALGAATAPACSRAANPARPNIIYLLADDLGLGDLGCYNKDSAIPTPNFDRVAREGMRFTDAHSPSSVCTPTRYGILTGRYCWRSRLKQGVLDGYGSNLIEQDRMTAASMLKSKGYYTAGVGKWHLGLGDSEPADFHQPFNLNPTTHGFDYYYGIPASLDFPPYVYFENGSVVEKPTSRTPGKNDPRGVFWREGPIAPSFKLEECLPNLADKAIGIIRDRAARPEPFFLYFPLTGPHTPWLPQTGFQGKSKAGIYGDFVAQVDDVLGRVLAALDETKTGEDTILVVASDNGAHWTPEDKAKFPHRSNMDWRGMKADIFEAGHRVPLMVRWPRSVRPGTSTRQLTCLTDFFATAADVAGVKLPKNAGEDSYSMMPALSGAKGVLRESIVHHSSQGMFAIRSGPWKLALGLGSGGFTNPRHIEPKTGEANGQLYNLLEDPAETRNLHREKPEIVKTLASLLDFYQRSGASRPL